MKKLLCLALLLAGCSPKSDQPVIGVSLLTQTHDFYKDLEEGMRAEAAARGYRLVVTSGEMDAARQAAQIEDFVAQKVRAIVVCPCDSAAIARNLEAAEKSGIPVFTADIAAQGGKIVSHVASDNVQGGRLAAQAMAKFLGGKGKVVVIDHPTVASVQDRVRGFEEEIRKHAGISIVGKPAAMGQLEKAMSAAEDMLQAHRDLAGIFGINDDSALGALAAVEKASGRGGVVIIGYDATPPARQAIERGSALRADVVQHPKQIGKTVVEMVARHLGGEKVPAVVPVEVGLVDRETLGKK